MWARTHTGHVVRTVRLKLLLPLLGPCVARASLPNSTSPRSALIRRRGIRVSSHTSPHSSIHITSHHSVDPSQAGSGSSPTPNTTYAHSCRILTPHLHPHTYPFSCTSILMHIHPHPYPSHHNPYSEIPPTHAHSSHTQHTRAYIYEVFVVYISQQG